MGIACGVLIIFGAVICCFGIFVHFATKRNSLKYGHCHNNSRSALPHHGQQGLHGPPAPAKPALSNVHTMSGLSGHYPMNQVASPEPDGFTMDIFTAPTGSLNPILQEKVGDLKVESNGDPELDDIVSPRMCLPPNVKVDGNESNSSAPESDGDEEWDLSSCSSSTANAP